MMEATSWQLVVAQALLPVLGAQSIDRSTGKSACATKETELRMP